jgi:hypothetical protein
MKYKLIIFFLAISSFCFSQHQTTDTSASCIANWKKGEKKILTISRGPRFAYEAHITVVDLTSAGYTLEWIFHLPEDFKKTFPGRADSMPAFEGMKMLYKTSLAGSFVELLNWQEVYDGYWKMMEFSLPKEMDSLKTSAIAKAKALFYSREAVEATLIKEIQLYHLPYGGTYSINEKKLSGTLPNSLFEYPLPAVETYKLTDLIPGESFKLAMRKEIEIKDAQQFLESMLKKMKVKPDIDMEQEKKKLLSLQLQDRTQYTFSVKTGWMNEVRYSSISSVGESRKTDFFFMRMKE